MRIDRLTLTNFKGFTSCNFELDPRFNLLVGDNATGKTSLLDALSIAVDSWFLGLRGVQTAGGIDSDQVRVATHQFQDRVLFEKQFPSRIEARGFVMGTDVTWARELSRDGGRTTISEAKDLANLAREADRRVREREKVTLPLICSYGTERLWFESRHWSNARKKKPALEWPSRFDGYRDCNVFQIQETELLDWIRAEVSASQQRQNETVALRVMKQAITGCVENATSVYYDERYKDLIVVIGQLGHQMFRHLSDGQRIMLTLVGDLVKRATTLNPHLGGDVLKQTSGIVMIDELDLHLHPKWQRRVIHDLKETFPAIQFVATTHSPQLIGEALPHEIRILDNATVTMPPRSFGVDSSRVLEELMGAQPRNQAVAATLSQLFKLIDEEDFAGARNLLSEVEAKLGRDDPELTRARTLMTFLESEA